MSDQNIPSFDTSLRVGLMLMESGLKRLGEEFNKLADASGPAACSLAIFRSEMERFEAKLRSGAVRP